MNLLESICRNEFVGMNLLESICWNLFVDRENFYQCNWYQFECFIYDEN